MKGVVKYMLVAIALMLSVLVGAEGKGSVSYGQSQISGELTTTQLVDAQNTLISASDNLFSGAIFRRNISPSTALSERVTPNMSGFFEFLNGEDQRPPMPIGKPCQSRVTSQKHSTHYYIVALHRIRI